MGRPHRNDSSQERENLYHQGQALANFRKTERAAIIVLGEDRFTDGRRRTYPTQKEFASHYGITLPTYKRYEKGETRLPIDIAIQLEKDTGLVAPYWMGQVPPMDQDEYSGWCACDFEEDTERKKRLLQVERYKTFFSFCGYRYDYDFALADIGGASFTNAEGETISFPDGGNILANYNEPEKRYYFNDDEIADIISEVKKTIAFSCFKKK